MQMPAGDWQLLALVGSVVVNSAIGVKWVYKLVRNHQINESFVEEMAHRHLPYIYNALHALCEKSGIEVDEHPNIGFIKLNGTYDKKD